MCPFPGCAFPDLSECSWTIYYSQFCVFQSCVQELCCYRIVLTRLVIFHILSDLYLSCLSFARSTCVLYQMCPLSDFCFPNCLCQNSSIHISHFFHCLFLDCNIMNVSWSQLSCFRFVNVFQLSEFFSHDSLFRTCSNSSSSDLLLSIVFLFRIVFFLFLYFHSLFIRSFLFVCGCFTPFLFNLIIRYVCPFPFQFCYLLDFPCSGLTLSKLFPFQTCLSADLGCPISFLYCCVAHGHYQTLHLSRISWTVCCWTCCSCLCI